ncbi:MAG: pyridoxamine 5'-phosphate oxidase [Solirubrobacterales bacterium]|nr:pyridoxamine 5'-phosphate oxidase [Solirubrobacterales bacterium]
MREVDSPLREEDVDPDPVRQFERWFEDARSAGAFQPEAAALATATLDGVPSVRMVLVKQTGPEGFVFFSNYESRKGGELAANPRAALMFHWEMLGRVVRIEGSVERASKQESAAYAHSRPRGSQLSALASPQSHPIPSRAWLEQQVEELAERYVGAEVPVGDAWGGYRLTPERFEFWQHRENRRHDRLVYTQETRGEWKVERLAP